MDTSDNGPLVSLEEYAQFYWRAAKPPHSDEESSTNEEVMEMFKRMFGTTHGHDPLLTEFLKRVKGMPSGNPKNNSSKNNIDSCRYRTFDDISPHA